MKIKKYLLLLPVLLFRKAKMILENNNLYENKITQ